MSHWTKCDFSTTDGDFRANPAILITTSTSCREIVCCPAYVAVSAVASVVPILGSISHLSMQYLTLLSVRMKVGCCIPLSPLSVLYLMPCSTTNMSCGAGGAL